MVAASAGLGTNATAAVLLRRTAQQQFRHLGGPRCVEPDAIVLLEAL
jgi:hypothetical protein